MGACGAVHGTTVDRQAVDGAVVVVKDEGHPEDQVMRVIWDEDDVAFELDFPDMMDMVYKWEGEPVLLVDPEMNRDFGDMILDVVAQDGQFNFFMTEADSSN